MPEPDLIIRRLVERGFEFVLIGGLAAVVHGVSLSTRDADICCSFEFDNVVKLHSLLEDCIRSTALRHSGCHLFEEGLFRRLQNLYLPTDLGALDCLSSVLGLGDYPQVRQQSIELRLWGGTCRILTIEALILSKQATNRPHDQQTIAQLRVIQARQRPPEAT